MNWKSVVSTVAPWIGTALGGPLGSQAASILCKLFGLTENSSEDVIAAAVSAATPEQMLALRKADQDFQLHMQELGFSTLQALEKIAADDRDSARRREIAVGDHAPLVLAVLIILGYAAAQGYILSHELAQTMREIIMRSLGTLDAALGLALGYFFGSSASSRLKDATLNNLVK